MGWNQFESKARVATTTWTLRISAAIVVLGGLGIVGGGSPVLAVTTNPAAPAQQRLLDEAIGGRCVPEIAKQVLRSYRAQIAGASTVDEARSLVLKQTRLARTALSTASWMLPFSDSVREAREKIENLETRVYAANSQAEVADDFSDLTAAGHDDVALLDGTSHALLAGVDVNKSAVHTGGCDYTTGEVVIIILGFLLFIIPGIIFLIIFC